MRIWSFQTNDGTGCYHYRQAIPFGVLREHGHEVRESTDTISCDANAWDIFCFSRFLYGDYPLVVDEVHEAGKPVIYDADDAMECVPRFSTVYFDVLKVLPSYYYMLQTADLVTTTTPYLAEHLKTLGAKNVAVLPNCIEEWPLYARRPGIIRIGFSGVNGHLEDVIPLLEGIAELSKTRKDFQFVFFGFFTTTVEEWLSANHKIIRDSPYPTLRYAESLSAFEEAYQRIRDITEWHPMVPMAQYPAKLCSLALDIGCCPLEDTEFNRCKSALKFYEYAMAGAVTLASYVEPFKAHPVCYARSWADSLSNLLDHPHDRHEMAQEQRQWVIQHRNPEAGAKAREEVYQKMIKPSLVLV